MESKIRIPYSEGCVVFEVRLLGEGDVRPLFTIDVWE